MHKHLALGLLMLPSLALAEPARQPLRDVIWGTRPKVNASQPTANLTSISHVIYMNNCLSGNCTLHPGNDDVHTRQSSIASTTVTLSPWPYGADNWQQLVACVQATYAPFDITVTDVDPGTADHSEIIVAGTAAELDPSLTNAGGVAPFLGCGADYDNVISFMFAVGDGFDLNYLCAGAAQETSHVFGLDHELNAADPMTYLDLEARKSFQNADAQCGETAGEPRECYSLFDPSSACAGPTQNSYQYLMDHFGPAMLTPASITIAAPAEGAYVKAGFAIKLALVDQLSLASAVVQVDGQAGATQTLSSTNALVETSAQVTGGAHAVTVTATDLDGRPLTASVDVHIMAACSATAPCTDKDTGCASGFCTPLADVAGGLGATCASNDDCALGACAAGDTQMLCTGTCDANGACPSGFDCTAAGSTNVCWPAPQSGGCSVVGGGGAPSTLLLLGLAGAIATRRGRRAR